MRIILLLQAIEGLKLVRHWDGWRYLLVEADDNGKTSPDKSFRPRERCEGTEWNWKRIQVFKPQSNHRILSNIFWKYCKKLTSTNRQSRRKGVKSPPTIF